MRKAITLLTALIILLPFSFAYDISDWQYSLPLSVVNPTNIELRDYTIDFYINTSYLIEQGKLRPDCGDLRLATKDGKIIKDYWIADGTCNTTKTHFFAKIPYIPSQQISGKTISKFYILYGNPNATYEGSIDSVAVIGDDFNDEVFDQNKWYSTNQLYGRVSGFEIEEDGLYKYGINVTTSSYYADPGLKAKTTLPTDIRIITYAFHHLIDTYRFGHSYPIKLNDETDGTGSYQYYYADYYTYNWSVKAVSPVGTAINQQTLTSNRNTWNLMELAIAPTYVEFVLNDNEIYNSTNFIGLYRPSLWSYIHYQSTASTTARREQYIFLDYLLAIKYSPDVSIVVAPFDFENTNQFSNSLPTQITLNYQMTPAPSDYGFELSFIIDTKAYIEKGIISSPEDINITPTPEKWYYITTEEGNTIYLLYYNPGSGFVDDYLKKGTIDVKLGKGYSTPNLLSTIMEAYRNNMIYYNISLLKSNSYTLSSDSNFAVYGAWQQEELTSGDEEKDIVIVGQEITPTSQSYGFVYVINSTSQNYYRIGSGNFIVEGVYFQADKVFLYGHEGNYPTIYYFDLETYKTATYLQTAPSYTQIIKAMKITRDFLITVREVPADKFVWIRYLDNYYRGYEYGNYTYNFTTECETYSFGKALIPREDIILFTAVCNDTQNLYLTKFNQLPKTNNITKANYSIGLGTQIVDYANINNKIWLLTYNITDGLDTYYLYIIDPTTLSIAPIKLAQFQGQTALTSLIPSGIDKVIILGRDQIDGKYYLTWRELAVKDVEKAVYVMTSVPEYLKSYYQSKIYFGQAGIIADITNYQQLPYNFKLKQLSTYTTPTKHFYYPTFSDKSTQLILAYHDLTITYPSKKQTIKVNQCGNILGTGTYSINIETATSECITLTGLNTIVENANINGYYAGKLFKVVNATAFIIKDALLDGSYTDAIYIDNSGGDIVNVQFKGTAQNLININNLLPSSPEDPLFVRVENSSLEISGNVIANNVADTTISFTLNTIRDDLVTFNLPTRQAFYFDSIIRAGEVFGYYLYPPLHYLTSDIYAGAGFTISTLVGNVWKSSETDGLSYNCKDTNRDFLCDFEGYSKQIDSQNTDPAVINKKLALPQLTSHNIIENSAQAKIDIPNQVTIYEGWNLSLEISATDEDGNLETLGYNITGDATYSDQQTFTQSSSLSHTFNVLLPSGTWTFLLYAQDFATYDDKYQETKDYSNPSDIYTISFIEWETTNEITAQTEIDKVRRIIPIATATTNYFFNGIIANENATTCKVNGQAYLVAEGICPYKWQVNQGETGQELKYNDDILGAGIPVTQNESDFIINGAKIYKNITLNYYDLNGGEASPGTFTNITTQVICNDNQVESGEYIAIYINGTKEDITPSQQGIWTEFTLSDGRKAWVIKDDYCYSDGVMDFKVKLSSNA